MMATIVKEKPHLVLVTGANGYIGSHVVKLLLEGGCKVRGSVTSAILSDESKTAFLKRLPNASQNLELVALDLEGPENVFDEVMDGGVEWVMHVASPIPGNSAKDVDDDAHFVQPAVQGVKQMLCAAYASGTVTNFVLTSSIAAIVSGHEKKERSETTTITEEMWSNPSGPCVDGYSKSKTLAEQEALKFMNVVKPKFAFTTLHPTFVFGPILSAENHKAGSCDGLIGGVLRGEGVASFNFGCPFVDVRDVAMAHLLAARTPGAASKRIIIHQSDGGELFMPEIANVLRSEFGPQGYTISKLVLPKWVGWLMSWFISDLKMMVPMINVKLHVDNSLSRGILKLDYTDAQKTIVDSGYSLIDHGLVRPEVQQQQQQKTTQKPVSGS